MTWEQAPREADWQRLIDALRVAESVVLVAHVNPDGDALGSALAAGLAMRSQGIPAVVTYDESPFRLPSSLGWLPGEGVLMAPDQLPDQVDVVVSFDAGSLDRLGCLGALGDSAGLFVGIDHHRSYTGFAEVSIVDVGAPATAVLAMDLVDRLGAELTPDIASCIYVGLTTDTGSFRFAGTDASTHLLAARLHESGIHHDEIASAVFDTQPFTGLQLLTRALERAEVTVGASGIGVVSAWVSKADRDEFDLPLDSVEGIIDTLRTTAEAEVAVILKEGDDEVWRVSTRSRGLVDLGTICSELGGGGHRFAAGYSMAGDHCEILAVLIERIDVAHAAS